LLAINAPPCRKPHPSFTNTPGGTSTSLPSTLNVTVNALGLNTVPRFAAI